MSKKRDAIKHVEKADIAVTRAAGDARDQGFVRVLGAFNRLADQPPLVAFCVGIAVAGMIRGNGRVIRSGGRMLAAHMMATQARR